MYPNHFGISCEYCLEKIIRQKVYPLILCTVMKEMAQKIAMIYFLQLLPGLEELMIRCNL